MKIAVLFQYCEFWIMLICSTRNFCSSSGSELAAWPFSAAGAFRNETCGMLPASIAFLNHEMSYWWLTRWDHGVVVGSLKPTSLAELGEVCSRLAVLL